MADKTIDARSLCGMKHCIERAFALFAWPKRLPVALCQKDRLVVLNIVEQDNGRRKPDDWERLGKELLK